MADTPIRQLALMLDKISQRQDEAERQKERDSLSYEEWAAISRIWSRQSEALSCAIIAEPPQTFDDVLAVLTELAAYHELVVGQGEEATERELRDLREMTDVAVKNCVSRLVGLFRPDEEPTEAQQQALARVSAQVRRWSPKSEER